MMAMPLNIIQFYVLFALTQMGNPIGLRKKIIRRRSRSWKSHWLFIY